MKAQDLIDEADKLFNTDWFKIFYPTLWELKQADENLTKVLRELK